MESKTQTSVSRVTTYKQCPRKYYYRYIKKLPVFDFWPQLIKGNFAHFVLDNWVRRLINGENPRECMVAAYEETKVLKEFRGKVDKFLEEIKPWLRQAVIDYEVRQFQPAAAEEKVSFRYHKFIVNGRIDRIDVISPTKVKIVDYKTTKNSDYLTTMQLGVYHIGVKYGSLKEQYGTKDIETAYILLRQDMREIPYVFREDELEAILTEVEEAVDLIESDTTWEPKPSKLCQYCDFFVPCTQERGSAFELNDFVF